MEVVSLSREKITELSFQIILHSGNARSFALEAIQLQKQGKTEEAKLRITEAENEFVSAHKFQTELIQREANGEALEVPIILVHAQDHLMTALTIKDLAQEIIEVYQKI